MEWKQIVFVGSAVVVCMISVALSLLVVHYDIVSETVKQAPADLDHAFTTLK